MPELLCFLTWCCSRCLHNCHRCRLSPGLMSINFKVVTFPVNLPSLVAAACCRLSNGRQEWRADGLLRCFSGEISNLFAVSDQSLSSNGSDFVRLLFSLALPLSSPCFQHIRPCIHSVLVCFSYFLGFLNIRINHNWQGYFNQQFSIEYRSTDD